MAFQLTLLLLPTNVCYGFDFAFFVREKWFPTFHLHFFFRTNNTKNLYVKVYIVFTSKVKQYQEPVCKSSYCFHEQTLLLFWTSTSQNKNCISFLELKTNLFLGFSFNFARKNYSKIKPIKNQATSKILKYLRRGLTSTFW